MQTKMRNVKRSSGAVTAVKVLLACLAVLAAADADSTKMAAVFAAVTGTDRSVTWSGSTTLNLWDCDTTAGFTACCTSSASGWSCNGFNNLNIAGSLDMTQLPTTMYIF